MIRTVGSAPYWMSDLLAIAGRPLVSLLTTMNQPRKSDPRSSLTLLKLRSDAFSLTTAWMPLHLTDPERLLIQKTGHPVFLPDNSVFQSDLPDPDSNPASSPASNPAADPDLDSTTEQETERETLSAPDTPTVSAAPDAPRMPADPAAPVISPAAARTVDPSKPMIALTFDDGPRLRTTAPILDTLKAYGAAATFFVLGAQVSGNEDALVRMAREGHEIGNHTFNHVNLTRLTEPEQRMELEQTGLAVAAVTGKAPALVRPTFGATDTALRSSFPMPLILWSVDTLDWKYRDPQRIVRSVLDTVRDGDIIILHDVYDSTAQAIRTLVPELANRGYQLVTVSELAGARGVALTPGIVFSKARPSTSEG